MLLELNNNAINIECTRILDIKWTYEKQKVSLFHFEYVNFNMLIISEKHSLC